MRAPWPGSAVGDSDAFGDFLRGEDALLDQQAAHGLQQALAVGFQDVHGCSSQWP